MILKSIKGSINLGECGFSNIEHFLKKNGVKFISKLCEDFDNAYRDFEYNGNKYTLHWNNYLGVEVLYYTDNSLSDIKKLLSKYQQNKEKDDDLQTN